MGAISGRPTNEAKGKRVTCVHICWFRGPVCSCIRSKAVRPSVHMRIPSQASNECAHMQVEVSALANVFAASVEDKWMFPP